MSRSPRALLVALLAASMLAVPEVGRAHHDEQVNHPCPLPPTEAQYHFHPGFTPPWDRESRSKAFTASPDEGGCGGAPWQVAGFGGRGLRPVPGEARIPGACRPTDRRAHRRGLRPAPVVFVHGNVVDAGDWYPALLAFAELGYTMCELWGLSYSGVGSNSGGAVYTRNPRGGEERGDFGGSSRPTNNTLNVPDLERFIRGVLGFTGARRFSLVSHSLGVTLARKVIKDNADLRGRMDAFVGIAGGNHGTTLCRGQEPVVAVAPERAHISCDELAPDAPPVWRNAWLAALNAPDETPGRARYLTVYDGSGVADVAFQGPDAESPRLEGALNCAFPGAPHNDLRMDPVISGFYAAFVAGRPLPDVSPGASPATPAGAACD